MRTAPLAVVATVAVLGSTGPASSSAAAGTATVKTCAALAGNTLDQRRIAAGGGFTTVRLVERGDPDQRISLCRDTPKGRKVVRLSRIWTDGGTFTQFIADGAIAADGGVVLQGQNLSDADPPTTFWYAYTPSGTRTAATRIAQASSARQGLLITDAGGYLYVAADGVLHGVDAGGDRALSTGVAAEPATGGNRAYWMEGDAPRTTVLQGRAAQP